MIRLGPPPKDQETEDVVPMLWYFCLRYIILWLSFVLNVRLGISSIVNKNGVFLGILSIIIGVCALFVRNALAKYKKDAPFYLTLWYILLAFCSVLNVSKQLLFNQNILLVIPYVIVPYVIFIIANNVYFKKRQHLFDE